MAKKKKVQIEKSDEELSREFFEREQRAYDERMKALDAVEVEKEGEEKEERGAINNAHEAQTNQDENSNANEKGETQS